jgi:motility quorum-sensing regulator / GCU-specific mRNA interferase toxin
MGTVTPRKLSTRLGRRERVIEGVDTPLSATAEPAEASKPVNKAGEGHQGSPAKRAHPRWPEPLDSDLARVQADVARLGAAAFTKSALDGGRAMGLTSDEMLVVIASLSRHDFYKSMTTYADHKTWQDVYHADTPAGREAYIKITMRDAAPVIQFKEKE